MRIRRANENDLDGLWPIFQSVVTKGDTYVFSPTATRQDAFDYWFGPGVTSFVAEDDGGSIAGMYKLIPNQRDLGAHVANASFMVNEAFRGQGIGKSLGLHCLEEAKKAGAVDLWKKLGFEIVGTLPEAFRHSRLGYVDAYVMYRFLDTSTN